MIRIWWLGLVLLGLTACQASAPEALGAAAAPSGPLPAQLGPPFPLGAGFPTAEVPGDNAPPPLREGEPAPDFRLVFPDGQTTTLSALRGRAVLLNFWATWCGPCRHEVPLILAQQEDRVDDWLVLAVNVKEPQPKVEAFAEEFAMQIPIVLDPQGDVVNLFQVRGFPTSIFLDRDGILVATWVGVLDEARLEQLVEASLS